MKKTNTIRRNSAGKAAPKRRLTLDEQLIRAIERKNIPTVTLECDENGNLIVDKEKYPEIYDWIENG